MALHDFTLKPALALKPGKKTTLANNTMAYCDLIGGDRVISITYHDNVIAVIEPDVEVRLTMCGYGTSTTRRRLNLILEEIAPHAGRFSQKDWGQYFDGQPIDPCTTITIPLTYDCPPSVGGVPATNVGTLA